MNSKFNALKILHGRPSVQDEPSFTWWVPYAPKKKDGVSATVQSRVNKSSHKYCIEVSTSTTHALEIDRRNGNTLGEDTLNLGMTNTGVAFKILEHHEHVPPGYSKSSGHTIWDLKMDFTRKARLVKDGHRTPDPESSKYAEVVSRESIRILLTHAAMHGTLI